MGSIKKKIPILLLLAGVMFCTACGGTEENAEKAADGTGAVMEGSIEVVGELPDRDITVPDYLKGENEEKLSAESSNENNPDQEESEEEPVYHLSGEEQTEMARQVAAQIGDSINQVLTDKEYYPHVTGISVNPECTEFNVTFSGRDLSLYENVLHMSLCIVGDRFQLYQGKQENELMTVVNYVDAESGEIFNTINSKEIQ